MQKAICKNLNKICLSLLSLTMLTSTAFGYDDGKLSYLDSMSSSYLYGQAQTNSALLNINSPEARGVETSLKLDVSPVITNSNSKINLSLRNSDLKQVLRMLASKAKLNIVFDESVDGKITLDLNNINLNDAFMVIFKSSKLTYVKDGNTITVMTLEAAKTNAYTRKNMTMLPVRYVNSDDVAKFLNDNIFTSNIFGLTNQPIVTSNPRTNQLVVFGSAADVAAVKRILPSLDTKPLVSNFKVNHTTPKEMAALICDSLFQSSNSSDSSSKGEENDDTENEDIVLGGGIVACQVGSSNSSSGSSSSSSSTSGENLTSFPTKPMSVAYFTDLGRVGVYGGSVEQAEMIKDFITEHDKKQMMAYIEVSIIELNDTGSKAFNNTWNLYTPFISLGFDGTNFTVGSASNPFFMWGHEVLDKSGNQTVTRSNNHALLYTLQYAIDHQNGRVLTNPKIMVTNGRKATIDMTSDYIQSVTSQYLTSTNTDSGQTGTAQRTYNIGSDEGIKVEIVPFISPDGYVAMNITPEFATVKSRVTDADGNVAATLLQRRDLELRNIRVRDGETLILAGLIKETEDQTSGKMPLLSDLPFVGAFFRKSSSNKERNEMVMVVTPHIIKDGDSTAMDNNDSQPSGKIYDL